MYHIYFVLPNPRVSTTSIYVKGARSQPQNVNLCKSYSKSAIHFNLNFVQLYFKKNADDDSLTQNEDPCKDEQLWDYLEATTKGIFRNKTGLVADIKGSVGPEVTMLSE